MILSSGYSAGFVDSASLGMTANFGNSADKSMLPQKSMHFFGQFSADAFGGRDLIHARPAKAIHRAEPPQ
jgi:hypothetical protein